MARLGSIPPFFRGKIEFGNNSVHFYFETRFVCPVQTAFGFVAKDFGTSRFGEFKRHIHLAGAAFRSARGLTYRLELLRRLRENGGVGQEGADEEQDAHYRLVVKEKLKPLEGGTTRQTPPTQKMPCCWRP